MRPTLLISPTATDKPTDILNWGQYKPTSSAEVISAGPYCNPGKALR